LLQPAKPRVLIVDDHPTNRLAYTTLLEPSYSVVAAETGQQALELTLRDGYAVILLDVRMPGMDGFEVAELLRKRERTSHTPIVFLSAFDQTAEQAKKGYQVGATDFLFSPIDGELLKFKVATYVQIYLRNESLRLQLHQLQDSLRALQEDIGDTISEQVHRRINAPERQVEEFKRELGSLKV